MATLQTISIWLIFMSSNLEKLGNPFVLKMPIDDSVEEILHEARQCIPSPVRDLAGATGLQLWRIKCPLQQPCSNAKSVVASTSKTSHYAHDTRPIVTLEQFLGTIDSSSILYLAECLQNAEDITDSFKEDPEQKIQALIRCPDLVIPKSVSSSKVPSDALIDIHDPAVLALDALLRPRQFIGSETDRGRELRDNVFIGRPAANFSYPNAIFDPDLAKLHYKLEVLNSADDDSGPLSPTELRLIDVSRDFLFNVIKNYRTEESYWEGCGKFFEHIFGSKGHPQKPIHTSATDNTVDPIPSVFWGILEGKGAKRCLPHVILEAKKEKGRGDTTMQCIKYYSEACYRWQYDLEIVKATTFPAILIGLNGNSLEISTVLTMERVVVNELLILNLTNSLDRNTTIRKLVRIASALAECAPLLEHRYRQVIQHDLSAHRPRRFLPHPTPDPRWPPSSPLPTLTFVGRLKPENVRVQIAYMPHLIRSLFVAKLVQDGTRVEVVVKFTANYNEQAHRVLADEGLAPKLYACQRVIGNLFMVVMERLEGTPMWAGIPEDYNYFDDSVFDDIRRAISVLQRHNLVHGDLRAVNIVVEPDGAHAKLVDFDWAGRSGIDRYSLTINKSELANEWHPDVEAGGPMETDHDVYALDEVLIPKFKFGIVRSRPVRAQANLRNYAASTVD